MQVPVDLVIDHSVQVDVAKSENAVQKNMEFEFHRNSERFGFLKWGSNAFHNMLVVPPGSGIVHQVIASFEECTWYCFAIDASCYDLWSVRFVKINFWYLSAIPVILQWIWGLWCWLQVNLEYLGRVVFNTDGVLYPDSVVGTDSHTTMIDGLGVAGWGVGGIEAEATMLGQVKKSLTSNSVWLYLIIGAGKWNVSLFECLNV